MTTTRLYGLTAIALLLGTACSVGRPAPQGGFLGSVAREGETLGLRLYNGNDVAGIGTLEAYGTITPTMPARRPINVRFDLDTVTNPTLDVPMAVTTTGHDCGG